MYSENIMSCCNLTRLLVLNNWAEMDVYQQSDLGLHFADLLLS